RGGGATLRGRAWANNTWYDVVRVAASGGEAKFVVRVDRPFSAVLELIARRQLLEPAFGPGGRIFYAEVGPGGGEGAVWQTLLVSVQPDGLDRRVHFTFPAADQAAISPDGKWLGYAEGDNVHVMPFPLFGTGATVPRVDRHGPQFTVKTLTTEGGN